MALADIFVLSPTSGFGGFWNGQLLLHFGIKLRQNRLIGAIDKLMDKLCAVSVLFNFIMATSASLFLADFSSFDNTQKSLH